jgi:hypothetical protein
MSSGFSLLQRGFSRFEFAVVAAVFAILVGTAAHRLNLYQQEIETVAAKQLIATVRAALQMKVAHLLAAQRQNELLTLADENPMEWLTGKPKNYLGEYYSPDNRNFTSASWYFDRSDRTLVYLLRNRNSFASHSSILLRFKVESLRLPSPHAAPGADHLALVQVADRAGAGAQ